MKYSELHRLIRRCGWTVERQCGSHVIYTKDGRTYPVPYHGSKEIKSGLAVKIKKEMGI